MIIPNVDDLKSNWIIRSKRMQTLYGFYFVNIPEGESGKWKVSKFTLGEDNFDLIILRSIRDSRTLFAGTYTRLTHKDRGVVMSDTIAEIQDHLKFTDKVEGGRILINGLGLGMVVNACLLKKEVTHIDVVEIDQDVINLVGPTYTKDTRVHIHHADAYTMKWPKGTPKWDYIWHDIWDNICDDNWPLMTKLHRKYSRKWTILQDSWSRDSLKSMKRREQPCYY